MDGNNDELPIQIWRNLYWHDQKAVRVGRSFALLQRSCPGLDNWADREVWRHSREHVCEERFRFAQTGERPHFHSDFAGLRFGRSLAPNNFAHRRLEDLQASPRRKGLADTDGKVSSPRHKDFLPRRDRFGLGDDGRPLSLVPDQQLPGFLHAEVQFQGREAESHSARSLHRVLLHNGVRYGLEFDQGHQNRQTNFRQAVNIQVDN